MEHTDIPNDLKEVIDNSQRSAESIVNSFLSRLQERGERKPPKLIYHYTNDVGLKGIIENGQLWLSDIFSLNDPSELRHGMSFAVNELKNKTDGGSARPRKFAELFASSCQDGPPEFAHFLTCSFSTNGNDLGQWRAYADNGRGYALGFDAEALAEIFKKEASGDERQTYTFPVTYEEGEIAEIQKQLTENIIPLLSLPDTKNLGELQSKNFLDALMVQFLINTLWPSFFFKHKAYENESEFRYLQVVRNDIPATDMKWRPRFHEVVKYRGFTWRVNPSEGVLKHIVIGPAADKQKATRLVNECLKEFHEGEVEITSSGIPYRAV